MQKQLVPLTLTPRRVCRSGGAVEERDWQGGGALVGKGVWKLKTMVGWGRGGTLAVRRVLRGGGWARLREVPLPCGSTTAIGCASHQSCSTTYPMRRWKRSCPWRGTLVCDGEALELEVGPVSEETLGQSRERSGFGSCKKDGI